MGRQTIIIDIGGQKYQAVLPDPPELNIVRELGSVTIMDEDGNVIVNSTIRDMEGFTHYLMSLDNIVAKLVISNGLMIKSRILDGKIAPIGVSGHEELSRWFSSRRIPASREHLELLQDVTGMLLDGLIEKSLALSLSDSFWVKPVFSGAEWRRVNFFDNHFSDDIGEFLMKGDGDIVSFDSPSNTTDGVFPKKWIIKNGIRYLVKRGSSHTEKFDDLNEIAAYKIARELGIDCVPYFKFGGGTCACPCFVRPGQNLVSADSYLLSGSLVKSKSKRGDSDPDYYRPLTEPFGRKWIDGMLVLDYIIMNYDRHTKNFGFLQDAATGELIKPAPIFDNSGSLFNAVKLLTSSTPFENIAASARPFYDTHDAQIALADTSPFISELRRLDGKIQDIIDNVYNKSGLIQDYIDGMGILLRKRVRSLLT